MLVLKQLRLLARYEVLTPVAVLAALAASPVLAAGTLVVTSPSAGVTLSPVTDDSLENHSTIDGSGGPGVLGSGNIVSITNFTGASISSGGGNGIEAGADLGTLINSGQIETTGNFALIVGGDLGTLINNADASIASTGSQRQAITISGATGSFLNFGAISSRDKQAIEFKGAVRTFSNAGEITTSFGDYTIDVQKGAGSFSNLSGGYIENTNPVGVAAVRFGLNGGAVGSFDNAGTIRSAAGYGVLFQEIGNGVDSFTNSGEIEGAESGVIFDGAVGSFVNKRGGTISSTLGASVQFNTVVDSFLNAGELLDQVVLRNAGSFTNSGSIEGGVSGLVNGHIASFNNSGTISGSTGVSSYGSFGRFTNSGTITATTGYGLYFMEAIDSFANSGIIENASNNSPTIHFNSVAAVRSFSNTGTIRNTGNKVAIEINGAASIGTFSNAGTISSTVIAINGAGHIGTFSNSGTITGEGGVQLSTVDRFINAAGGTIRGADKKGASFDTVGSFINAGDISTGSDEVAVAMAGVTTFLNSGTLRGGEGTGFRIGVVSESFVNSGAITSQDEWGGYIENGVRQFSNSGTIAGQGGVSFVGGLGSFTNSGTITGTTGAAIYIDDSLTDTRTLANSGVLRGNGIAVLIDSAADTNFKLLTGSEIYGALNFGTGSADTLDFSGFYGTAVIAVDNLEHLAPGDRAVLDGRVAGTGLVAIFDQTGATSMGSVMSDTVGAVRDAIGGAFGDLSGVIDAAEPSGYVADRQPTAAEQATNSAVLSELAVGQASGKVWGKAFGGVSRDDAPVALSNLYGGLVAGTHFALDGATQLGALAGYARSNFDVANGQQTITTDTGVVGIYGKTDLGVVALDYSLLGGASGHSGSRDVVVVNMLDTLTASFSSWFISPSLGISVPVLSADGGEVNVAAAASYIHGGVSAYTETGSLLSIAVGAAPIGVFDGRLELNGKKIVGATDAGDVSISGKLGVMVQANVGGSSMPVAFSGGGLSGSSSFTAPGTTTYGAYGGMGLSAAIAAGLDFNAAGNGSVRADGTVSLAAQAGVSGTF